MKRIARAALLFGALAVSGLGGVTTFSGCGGDKEAAEAQKATKVTLVIDGTTCGGCAQHIEEALGKLDGVIEAKASHDQARAWITYDAAKIGVPGLIQAIEKAGYKGRVATYSENEPPTPPATPGVTTELDPPASEKPGDKPATGAPADPTTGTPAVPTTDDPAVPTTDAPADPTTGTPAVPTTDDPAVPTTDAPADPTTGTPAVPTTDARAVPTTDDPAVPATDAPADPTTGKPAVPTTDAPADPAAAEPKP